MFRFLRGLSLLVISLLSSCGWIPTKSTDSWRDAVNNQTSQLGYRNWIVIAEAAFPAHSRVGIRQINANDEAPQVLDQVLRSIESTEHVTPRIYVPRELRSVENNYAPGIEDYRAKLQVALHGYETTELEQDSLMTLIQDTQKSFNVLVIRTNTALPYTSIFIELQPGYWDGEAESHLRQRIQHQRMEKLAQPTP